MKQLLPLSLGCSAVLFLAACANGPKPVSYVDPNAQGTVAGTGIESQDVKAAAAKAAQSIVLLPQIASAPKPPIILIAPVINRSSTPIDGSLYTSILRDQLISSAAGKVRFIDRDLWEQNKKEQQMLDSGEVTGGSGKRAALTYDYLLTAELQGIGLSNSQGQSDYSRVAFKLLDRKTDILLWTDAYEMKKEGGESAVYR
jgi:PBP1b-binding outer membrane lipoprotein LpoB